MLLFFPATRHCATWVYFHVIFFVLSATIAIAVAVFTGITIWNILRFRRLRRDGQDPLRTSATVSILVPARNEERCIEANVRSLCLQSYENVHVHVLDDGSTDGTPAILARLQKEFPDRLSVIHGGDLPPDWVGKSWACHRLSQVATGDYLLFTDADTIHAPDTVARAVSMAQQDRIDFFSLIPFEEMGSPMEHIVIPMVHVLYFAYLPNELILRSPMVSISAANGQFMWFSAAAYRDIGGHTAVRNDLVEDVALAKHVKRAGLRTALVDGSELVQCRMYTTTREVVDGFSKNFFPATGYNLPLMLAFVSHLVLLWTLPVLMVVFGMISPDLFLWQEHREATFVLLTFAILCGAFIRLSIALRFGMPWWHVFLQPMSAAMAAFIGLRSIVWAYSRSGASWKGRSYSSNRNYHVRTNTDRQNT